MFEMLYSETNTTRPAFNLALEEALLEAVPPGGPGRFLLWQNSPAVIIGRHQNAQSEVNLPELKRRGIDLVRRMTGGGAVYHDLGNLNFSFIIPLAGGREIRPADLLAPLINYLIGQGLDVVMEGRNDLSIAGAGKFSGLAGRRLPGRYQLHGTIMHQVDLNVLSQILRVDPEKYKSKGLASVRARVTNLADHLPLTLPELWSGVKAAFGLKSEPVPVEIQDRAAELAATKYSRDDWNIGQSPPADIFLKKRFTFGLLELHLATRRGLITEAKITGDFLIQADSREQSPVARLESTLVGLPADKPCFWAEAWRQCDPAEIFYGQVNSHDICQWLAEALKNTPPN